MSTTTLNRKQADLVRFGFKTKTKSQVLNIILKAYYTNNLTIKN